MKRHDYSRLSRFSIGTKIFLWNPGHPCHGSPARIFSDDTGFGAEIHYDHYKMIIDTVFIGNRKLMTPRIDSGSDFLYLTRKEFENMKSVNDVLEL